MSPLAARLRVLSRAPIRAFHSPFVVLNVSNHLTTPSPSAATSVYEKQDDSSPEPHLSSSGTRTYVVSEPDPSNTPYEVPSGAYPTSTPYVNLGPTTAANPEGLQSSTSSSLLHPHNTRAVPQKEAGGGESTAVRNAEIPGELGRRGGSRDGIGLMDAARTKPGKF